MNQWLLYFREARIEMILADPRLKDKMGDQYKFLLAGNGDIDKVKKIIKDKNLEDFVIVPGWISDDEEIEKIYRQTAIYLLPSYNEGMPMSILEAMSFGIPVISTNVGAIPKVVEKENGYIIEPGDLDALENKILSIIEHELEYAYFKNNNIKKINELYDIRKSIDKIVSIYRDVNQSQHV